MMYENLELGNYVSGKGYFHFCAFPKCGDPPFFGRKNQLYHSDCKKRMDAERAAEKRGKTKKMNNTMAKNRYILEELYLKSRTLEEIPVEEFLNRGFDFKGPTKLIKIEHQGIQCHLVHDYAYSINLKTNMVLIFTENDLHRI